MRTATFETCVQMDVVVMATPCTGLSAPLCSTRLNSHVPSSRCKSFPIENTTLQLDVFNKGLCTAVGVDDTTLARGKHGILQKSNPQMPPTSGPPPVTYSLILVNPSAPHILML